MKRIVPLFLIIVLVLMLCYTCAHPFLIMEDKVSESYEEAIRSQSSGLYSDKLPLVPVCVSVKDYIKGTAYYTIYYFPLGTVEMSYRLEDGYNIEKPLMRWY